MWVELPPAAFELSHWRSPMRTSRVLPLLIATVLVLAAGALWLLDTSESPASAAGAPQHTATPGAAAPTPERGAPLELAAATPDSEPPVAAGQRQAAVSGRQLDVLLELPSGTPVDPTLAVLAVPSRLLDKRSVDELLEALRTGEEAQEQVVRAAVEGARARLQLPESLADAQVILDGRFLYLAAPRDVTAASELHLAPKLGACVLVELEAPPGAEFEGQLTLVGADFSGATANWAKHSHAPTPVGQAEFRGLDTDLSWSLSFDLPGLHAYTELGIELEPGDLHTESITLTRGAAVSGRVVDDNEQPVADVSVRASVGGMQFGVEPRSAVSDSNGEFELLALGPGELQVTAVADGWITAQSEELELAEGERQDDLHLVLSRGLAIAGRVLLPDGAPASGAEVVLRSGSSRGGFGNWGGSRRQPGKATCDDAGEFRATGLEQGKYAVSAEYEVGPAEAPVSWRAREDSVEAGRSDVLLTLAGPLAFAGRVVDDRGEPVTQFEVQARAALDGRPTVAEPFDTEDGAFVFTRVGPGDWELTASAKGHQRSEMIAVRLPGPERELGLELRLPRLSSIAGRVLDSTGAGVAQAVVQADDGRQSRNPWGGARGPQAETDDEGRFELTGITPGARSLVASAEQWADSLPLTVEIAPGEARANADLALRVGGRIEGMVVTAEGDPEIGVRVSWGGNPMGMGSSEETRTDGGGRFFFEHVTPGEWNVSTALSMAEIGEKVRGRRGQSAFIEAMGDMLTKTVTVVDGELTEVYLGGEPKRPVRIFGAVSRAGEAVAEAPVFAISEDSAMLQGMKAATSAADGSYEFIVDRPGSYVINATAGRSGMELVVEVPRVDELRVDLTIPLGRIEGIVREPNASAAKSVRLSLQREDGLGRVRWAGNETRTGDDGRYAFEDLEQGTYTVRANVSSWGGSAEQGWGSALLAGIVVGEDETASGIDFKLQAAGSVSGLVHGPDGSPAAGVTIFFRSSAGLLVSTFSSTVTDAVGRFEADGLAPDAYSVSARDENLAASEVASVTVRSGETAELELEVEVGTVLVVSLEEADGTLRRARVEVSDSDGLVVSGLMTVGDLQATFSQGSSSSAQRVGPLPRGRYTVRAIAPDGRSQEKRVSLRGREGEKAVRLRLEAD